MGAEKRTYTLQHFVQWFQDGDHTFRVLIIVIQSGSFLKPLVPKLVPKNGNAEQFVAD